LRISTRPGRTTHANTAAAHLPQTPLHAGNIAAICRRHGARMRDQQRTAMLWLRDAVDGQDIDECDACGDEEEGDRARGSSKAPTAPAKTTSKKTQAKASRRKSARGRRL
jgi:hypothetical protein